MLYSLNENCKIHVLEALPYVCVFWIPGQVISEPSVDVSRLDKSQMKELIRRGIPGLDYVNREWMSFSSVDALSSS